MAEKQDGKYWCDCGYSTYSSQSLIAHSQFCDDYTPLRVRISCDNCGETFVKKPCEIEKGEGIYCSQKCYGESEEVVCKECGIVFSVYSSAIERGRGKFCSKACRDLSYRRKSIEPLPLPRELDGYDEDAHEYVYVIEMRDRKERTWYYVGASSDPGRRISTHKQYLEGETGPQFSAPMQGRDGKLILDYDPEGRKLEYEMVDIERIISIEKHPSDTDGPGHGGRTKWVERRTALDVAREYGTYRVLGGR